MIDLSEKQIGDFYHRSYTAADGLWFMKVEEKYGFDIALDIDNEVWKIVPKIQARMLKSMGNTGDGIDALIQCLETKLHLEKYKFHTEKIDNNGYKIVVTTCPWHDLMVKSGRRDLSGKVGKRICTSEFSTWAHEFDPRVKFKMETRICCGEKNCILSFTL